MPILLNNAVDKVTTTFDLRTPTAVAEDNGTITGSPTFSRDGADFDGSADYVTYAIPNTLMSSVSISIIVEFTPDFAATDGVDYFLYDTPTNNRYLVKKTSANTLLIWMGDTSIATLASGSYAAYWKEGERNVLTISSNGVLTNAWLNGTQILTDNSTAWTVKYPTELSVGIANTIANYFDGKIHSVSVKNDLTTAGEA